MINQSEYKICNRCVMDTSATGIQFNSDGLCNYCLTYKETQSDIVFETDEMKTHRLNGFVERIQREGKGKPYDCIVGVSGGVDSSWALIKAKQLGLRPLAVHMDNGWNSELTQNNISNLINSLEVDLYTHVIDWDEYRQLMQGFFDADVIDIELLYDNAMLAVNYQQASKYNLKYILSGGNSTSEGMLIPKTWNWFKFDKKNIKCIGKLGSVRKLKTFPAIGTLDFIYYRFFKKVKFYQFLDYFPYNKFEAIAAMKEEFGFKPYPYKHYESIFTRFYQGYILPEKFGVDKRRVHLSALIMAGQISREDAIALLKERPYPDAKDEMADLEYFLKKMKWTQSDFDNYMKRPEKEHKLYGSEKELWNFFEKILLSIRQRRITKNNERI